MTSAVYYLLSFGQKFSDYMGFSRTASNIRINSTLHKPACHYKCRSTTYVRDDIVKREQITDEQVPWDQELTDYKPTDYTSPSVLQQPVWADFDFRLKEHKDRADAVKWNALDGKVDRRSFTGKYRVQDKIPLNPVGRTGVQGRGCLGRWGPNHAADPIVTRWKRYSDGKVMKHETSKKPMLQFIAILRGDTKEWAIPGGMVDPGECVSITLKREFSEEAMSSIDMDDKEKLELEKSIDNFFKKGSEIYRGYVDDPRNTDNSWMETVAVNFHDSDGSRVGRFKLHAGDDAVGVQWTDIDSSLALYASHAHFIKIAAQKNDAHF